MTSALDTETAAGKTMLERHRRKRLRPSTLGAADKGYHSKDFVAHLHRRKIAPHIAMIDGREHRFEQIAQGEVVANHHDDWRNGQNGKPQSIPGQPEQGDRYPHLLRRSAFFFGNRHGSSSTILG